MIKIIKDKNQRITKQRELILDELCKVCTHPTAHEIHNLVLKKNPNIGLATVYRTLDFLEQKNLIIKLKSKNNEARYDGNVHKHCHLICKKCGKIEDIFDVKGVSIKSNQIKKSEFDIDTDFLEIHGICKKCKS